MAKREKKTVTTGVTEEQMNEALVRYATADARLEKILAEMDLKIAELKAKRIDEIAKLENDKSDAFDIVQAYGLEQKDVVFLKKKSLDLPHGIIGFRRGTPKLKTLKGFTWASVTNLLKEFMPQYVRVSEEPAKDRILADRDIADIAEQFGKVGIAVVQDESFFIELKKEGNE